MRRTKLSVLYTLRFWSTTLRIEHEPVQWLEFMLSVGYALTNSCVV